MYFIHLESMGVCKGSLVTAPDDDVHVLDDGQLAFHFYDYVHCIVRDEALLLHLCCQHGIRAI